MPHRNSLENPEPHHLYEIVDRLDDFVFKFGISCLPFGADGLSERIREQVNLLNRVDEWPRFFARILIYDIPGKRAARRLETGHILEHEKIHGFKPRGNPIS